jgi:hypothetical protein
LRKPFSASGRRCSLLCGEQPNTGHAEALGWGNAQALVTIEHAEWHPAPIDKPALFASGQLYVATLTAPATKLMFTSSLQRIEGRYH